MYNKQQYEKDLESLKKPKDKATLTSLFNKLQKLNQKCSTSHIVGPKQAKKRRSAQNRQLRDSVLSNLNKFLNKKLDSNRIKDVDSKHEQGEDKSIPMEL